jgi:epoxyqueuosine reductase QueG
VYLLSIKCYIIHRPKLIQAGPAAGSTQNVNLTDFFREQGPDVFAGVGIDSLSAADRSLVLQFFPEARFVIVFGKEVPAPAYLMPPEEKTREMLRIAGALDATAVRLAARLEAEDIPAKAVPLYLPVRFSEGRVQGVVRLKQVAAAGGLGSLGRNTVLLSPRFGPRLLLSGVVAGDRAGETGLVPTGAGWEEGPACTGCGRCISECPTGALGSEGADAFRCRTVSAWIPSILVPAAKWMLRRTLLVTCIAPLAPWIARMATIRCSLCITACPHFSGTTQEG